MVTYGYLTHPHIQLDHHSPQMGSPGSRTIKGARYNAKTLAKPACLASNRRTNVERERSQGIDQEFWMIFSGILDDFFSDITYWYLLIFQDITSEKASVSNIIIRWLDDFSDVKWF